MPTKPRKPSRTAASPAKKAARKKQHQIHSAKKPRAKVQHKGPPRSPRKKVSRKKLLPEPIKATPAENPEARKLAHQIAQLVLDKKALDVVVLDVRGLTSYADYFVVASGESERQVSAMAEGVATTLRHEGRVAVGSEGQETGNWILLDYGEVVAHLFYAETRAFYDLEGLWADAPREKVG
jgi:ribosome-associated protein